jgi:hypothetical protein
MKKSIHAGEEKMFGLGNLLLEENKPLILENLDKIKNKQLVKSVMNEDVFEGQD